MAAGIDREAALEIQRRAFLDFLAMIGGAAADSRVLELDGDVRAAIVPSVPERSIANSVGYRDPSGLAASLDLLAAAYDRNGVVAWTVWAPDHDREAIAALERAGHAHDGSPAAMVLDLAELREPEIGDLDWDADAGWGLLGRLNDEAYGDLPGGGLAPAFRRAPADVEVRIYQARVGGEPACVLATIDHAPVPGAGGPDCGVYFVATPERFRRRGLATRLIGVALSEARARGCATSSLQASALGEPVYAALGYETCFRFAMYERRRPREAP